MGKQLSTSGQITQGLILLGFLLPLTYFPGLISLYRLPKTALLAFLTTVLCWLWISRVFFRDDDHPFTLPLAIPLLSYLLVGALSLIGSINPYEGANPYFQAVLGVSLFWITCNYIEKGKLSQFFHWVVLAAGIVSVLGIAQAWGANIPTLISVGPPGSTFGNRNMAAQYLLFVLPAVFYLLLSASERAHEWLYAPLAGLTFTYFAYTGTRAAWGAVGFSAIMLVLFFVFSTKRQPRPAIPDKRKRRFLFGIAIFVVLMNTLPPYLLPNFGGSRALPRLESMMELETDTSAKERFAIWANSLAIFADHPVLGAGKGSFRFIYPVYARRVVEDPSFTPQQRATDAHNDYIQLLAETGLLGAASFLAVLAALAIRFWRGIKTASDPLLLVVAFALVAILAEAFWDFPFNLPVPVAFFWIFAGVLWKLTSRPAGAAPRKSAKTFPILVAALVTLAATAFSVLTLSSLRGEFYYSRGIRETYGGDLSRAEQDITKATQISPLNYRYHFLLGLLLIRMKAYEKAADSIRHSLSLNPYNINALNNLGVAYASAGNSPKAIQAFQTALRIWPKHIEAHKNIGTIYAREGERDKAIRQFQTVLALDPTDPEAREFLLALGALGPRQE